MASHLVNLARQLAICLVDTPWQLTELENRLASMLDGGFPNPHHLAARLCLFSDNNRSPRFEKIVQILLADQEISRYCSQHRSLRLQPTAAVMQPRPDHLLTLPLPRLESRRELARWFSLSDRDLDWFAGIDRRYRSRGETRCSHYHYEWRPRSSGIPRLLEKPKTHLKAIQRQILKNILERVPVHDNAHGFRRHHSCLTAAVPHSGSEVLLRMDLQDFFTAVSRARVEGIFRMIGYPESVAAVLAGLCTHRTLVHDCGKQLEHVSETLKQRLMDWHLPQGAPTSPALANLCAWRLDTRLTGLADRFELKYTRYADDLAFSGSNRLYRQRRFTESLIGAITLEEGFQVNHRKTHWMRASQRQHFCGITLNRRPNQQRKEFDELKAILHNCIRYGPESQNRNSVDHFRQHLEGRISYVSFLNPQRGEKLQKVLQEIDWS